MTAPVFHRLATPTYFGGLPANFDYLNNAVTGTPANANPVLASGPNAGSYFVGFGDDGTSADANRPALALGTNTDFLDNIVHQDLAYITRTADVGPTGSPTSTVTLTGPGIWIGNTGGYLLRDLFHVVDSNDQDIVVGGTAVVVASFTGGTVGSGFSTGNLVLTLNSAIPTGTQYHIYYAVRSNVASLPVDALTLPFMRDEGAVSAGIANFVSQVSAPGVLGSNVTSLQAAIFSTPDGHSLAKTNTMVFDCDPTDSGAAFRRYLWRTKAASTDRIAAALYDDPTGTLIAGLTGLLQLDAGMGLSSLGTMVFSDMNTSTGGPSGVNGFIALTGNSNGDAFPRVLESPAGPSLGAVAPSLMRLINGRWACTCGDGTVSFGDFNGPGALDAALTYANVQSITSFHIQLKRGNFTLAGSYSFNGDVLIEGVSMGQTVVTTAVTSVGDCLFTFTPGRFALKNFSLVYGSGTGNFISVSVAPIWMDSVALIGISLSALNAVGVNGLAAVMCRGCLFMPSAANTYSVSLQVGDGTALHQGFVFRDCSWVCADETGPVQVMYVGPVATTIGGILFDNCTYVLGGTATVSGHLKTNTGVLSINPNGSNTQLTVADVTWKNCNPSGNTTTLANGVLARIYPIALGDNSSSHPAIIGSLTFTGGTWACNSSNSSISQFLVSARTITVDGTVFVNGGSITGGPSSEDQFIVDGTAHTIADWHQFIFATPGGSAPFPNCLHMHNALFNGNFISLSNAGDVWLYAGANGRIDVDGVRVQGYFVGGGGPDTLPNARVRISPNGAQGVVSNLQLRGSSAGAGVSWTAETNPGYAALVLIEPAASAAAEVTFDRIGIDGFSYVSPSIDDGIVIVNPTTGTPAWPYTFLNCRAKGVRNGLSMYGQVDGGSGGPGVGLDNFHIRGGDFSSNVYGIYLGPDTIGLIDIEHVRCVGNVVEGLLLAPFTWANSGPSCATLIGNHWAGNNSNGDQAYIKSRTAVHPHVVLKGNTALTSAGAIASIKVQDGAGGALPGSSVVGGGGILIWGAHTGISGGGDVLIFTTGNPMIDNMANLLTP